jgi:protein-L-isoaspartate(D-aspartate) O-methyltransferase
MNESFAAKRALMVETQLVGRGIANGSVLDAMRSVPRHLFVPEPIAEFAYEDGPLEIGEGQTISQPYIVALMAQALSLSPSDRVLEIGTGSGYGAAVISRLCAEIFTIERHRALAEEAR